MSSAIRCLRFGQIDTERHCRAKLSDVLGHRYPTPRAHAYLFVLTGRCQFSIVTCFARATVNFAAGTSFTTVDPAAMVAPAPTVIGATKTLLDPVCTSFSIVVRW